MPGQGRRSVWGPYTMPANGDWSILLEQRPELLTVLLALCDHVWG